MKFQDACPNCGLFTISHNGTTYPWYSEDEDGANAINPTGFYCDSCYGPAGIEEEVKTEAKATCRLFAQPVLEVEPVSQEVVRIECETRTANLIQIKFFNAQFSFQNGNEVPVIGQITGFVSQTKLLRRAMELARDEGKELRVINGMDMQCFKSVSDKDIQIHCGHVA